VSVLPVPYRKWAFFTIGTILLYSFAFGFLPFLSNFLGFRQAHDLIIEEGIEAGAFFYTGVEKIRDIENYLRDSQQYGPSLTAASK